MKNAIVTLLAAIYYAKKNLTNCPVCGNGKTSKQMVCPSCFSKVGDEAVFNRAMSALAAIRGHEDALEGGVERKIETEAVLANIKIARDAQLLTPDASTGIKPYRKFALAVGGGVLEVSVFDSEDTDVGRPITGMVELKTRKTAAGEVYYLRVQKAPGVSSDANVRVLGYGERTSLRSDLPIKDCKTTLYQGKQNERNIRFSLGFVQVV